MAVTSRELKSDTTRTRRPKIDPPGLLLSGVGTLLLTGLWLVGARYTLDGVLTLINSLLNFLTVPTHIPIPPGWQAYLGMAFIPIVFSIIEWHQIPLHISDEGWQSGPFGQWLVWLLVYALDAYTTWKGLGVVDDTAPTIWRELSQISWARGIMTAVLTIGPEALLRSMVAIFKQAVGRR
jgi:hypothetical protein